MKTSCSWFANLLTGILLMQSIIGSAIGFESAISLNFSRKNDEGICKLFVEPIGYMCEEHLVTTKDGYILSMQRIRSRANEELRRSKPPVLLQHGLISDGAVWFMLPPEKSLPGNLLAYGYEVWITSDRGTKYSLDHRTLTPANPAYWDWTWQDQALYDLPATLHYVKNQTGQRMHLVADSLGTTFALAGFAKYKVTTLLKSAVLMSPVAYMGHCNVVIRTIADTLLAETILFLGFAELDPRGSSEALGELYRQICRLPEICNDLLGSISGPNCCIKSSMIGNFFRYELQPSSTKNYIHLAQMIRSGVFKMYDYEDDLGNMKHYGVPTPPVFDLTKIPKDFPMFINYGGVDALAVTSDVKFLLQDLRKHKRDKLVVQYHPEYAHFDFILGEGAKQDVYDPIIAWYLEMDQNNVTNDAMGRGAALAA